MQIYKITFKKYNYDQYDSFILVSESEEKAIKHLLNKYPITRFSEVDWSGGYTIQEINAENFKETTILLDSYNAG